VQIRGLETNLEYLRHVVAGRIRPEVPTSFLNRVNYTPAAFEVLEPGLQTTVQDYPGRTGYWHVGVPPSGPMDTLAFRLANRLVGNPESAAALECTLAGPALRFYSKAVVALAGADMSATLNGSPVPYWQALEIQAGWELRLHHAAGPGSVHTSPFAAASTCPNTWQPIDFYSRPFRRTGGPCFANRRHVALA
jgi:urea carboxylase